MQCRVTSNPSSSLWPCEGSRSDGKAIGRSGNSTSLPRRKDCRGQLICSGSWSNASLQLGFLENGMLLAHKKLRKWTYDYYSLSSAAPAERKEGCRVHASLLVDAAVSIIRTTGFYILLETGIAAPGRFWGSPDSIVEEAGGPLAWIGKLLDGEPEEKRNRKLGMVRSKWHTNTKGVLVRRYRVPSKAVGRKLLTAISSLLADEDTFRDVATHKGCQIRRENAHAESVCWHNVRALFDELPTPHLVVEMTGPINTAQYEKADKIEKILRTGASI